jgi:DNA-binding MarR family transcriptional regulator
MDRRALERDVLAQLRALSAADGMLNAAVADAIGIHPTDLQAGDALDRRGPMTIGELAREVRLSPGAATALVDRLERAGIAVRRPDPSSRRRVLVTPAPRAAARVEALFGPLTREAGELLASYSDRDLEVIREFLATAGRMLSEHGEGIRRRARRGSSRARPAAAR